MQNKIIRIFVFLILNLITTVTIAQPYYFYEQTGPYDSTIYEETVDIYRVNLATGAEQLFIEHIYYPYSFTWDNFQSWFILNQPKGIYFYRPWNTIAVDSLFPNTIEDFGVMAYSVDSLGYLFIGWVEPQDSGYGGISNSIRLEINSLQLIKENVPSFSNDGWTFASRNLNYIYPFIGADSLGVEYLFKYSIEQDSIVQDININNLFPDIEYPVFNDGKNGIALFGYNEIMSDSTTCKYITYDFDNELFSQEIPCPFRCYGHLISNAEYFILEQVLWDENKPGAQYFTGVINLYKTTTGELVKNFSLPPEGKLLLFDSYPNKIFYYVSETGQIITINIDDFDIK